MMQSAQALFAPQPKLNPSSVGNPQQANAVMVEDLLDGE
jgi:hypothetical protein